jgi:antitoxin PrlF
MTPTTFTHQVDHAMQLHYSAGAASEIPGRHSGEETVAGTTDMITSKVTARSQTTLPPAVRTVLGIEPGDRIGYEITGHEVRLVKLPIHQDDDPTLDAFLELLTESIATTGVVRPLQADLLMRAVAASADEPVDHDAPIHGAVAL